MGSLSTGTRSAGVRVAALRIPYIPYTAGPGSEVLQ